MKTIKLKDDISEVLEQIRKQAHPLSTFNMFGNYIIANFLLENFANDLTKQQIKKLEVLKKK